MHWILFVVLLFIFLSFIFGIYCYLWHKSGSSITNNCCSFCDPSNVGFVCPCCKDFVQHVCSKNHGTLSEDGLYILTVTDTDIAEGGLEWVEKPYGYHIDPRYPTFVTGYNCPHCKQFVFHRHVRSGTMETTGQVTWNEPSRITQDNYLNTQMQNESHSPTSEGATGISLPPYTAVVLSEHTRNDAKITDTSELPKKDRNLDSEYNQSMESPNRPIADNKEEQNFDVKREHVDRFRTANDVRENATVTRMELGECEDSGVVSVNIDSCVFENSACDQTEDDTVDQTEVTLIGL